MLVVAGLIAAIPLSGAGKAVSDVPDHLVFTTSPTTTGNTGGVEFPQQPVVTVVDSGGTAVADNQSTVMLAVTAGGSGTVSGCQQSETGGVVTFSGCSIDTAGTGYVLTATDGGLKAASSATFDVGTGDIAKAVFTQQPTDINANQLFSNSITVSIEDKGGNVVDSSDLVGIGVDNSFGSVGSGFGALVCTGGETASPGGGTAAGFTVAAVNGVATFPDCTINKASSSQYELLAGIEIAPNDVLADDGTNPFDSSPFMVSSSGASQLVFTTNPSGAVAGQAFKTPPVVAAEDSSGDTDTSVSGTVTLAITAGTGDSTATLSSCTAQMSLGVASFSGCSIDKVSPGGHDYTLTASISTHPAFTGVSQPFIVSVGGAAGVEFQTSPTATGTTGGVPFAQQPVVRVVDSGNNLASGSVLLTLQDPSGASLTCDQNPLPAGSGVATFSGCSVDLAGTYTIVASDVDDPGGATDTSHQFTISVGDAAQLAFTQSPGGGTGGAPFTGLDQPQVTVEDLGGNPVLNSDDDVTLGIASGGAPGASLACTGANPANSGASGVSTFSGCSIDKAGSGYVLSALWDGHVATSPPFNITPGVASKLIFSTDPMGGVAGSPIGGQPQVQAADAGGNPVVDPNLSVTLSEATGPGSFSCLHNTVATDNSGIAFFTGCQGTAAGGLTLQATANSGALTGQSHDFTLTSGTPFGAAPTSTPFGQTIGGVLLGRNPTNVTDEVNSATGALELNMTDLKVAGVGVPFTASRQYNSLDTSVGAFGQGWSSMFDAGVTVTGSTAVVRDSSGQRVTFTSNGHSGWVAPPGARATLTCTGALCTVSRDDGVSFQSLSNGRILDWLSPDGYGLHFIYAGTRLVQVTGSAEALAAGVQELLGSEVGTLGWTGQNLASGVNLNAVDAVDPNHIWAVGDNCTIEYSSNGGMNWTKDMNVAGCSGANLTGVAIQGGAGPGWAVGTGGTILVCSNGCNAATAAWKAVTASSGGLPTGVNFSSVWEPDPNHVYAVGITTSATPTGAIWACSAKCDSTGPAAPPPGPPGPPAWTNVTPSGLAGITLNGVGGAGGGLVFAVGTNSTILVCNAPANCATSSSAWKPLSPGSGGNLPSSGINFTSVWAADPNHVYAVGSNGGNGVIWACSANCNQNVTGPDTIPSPPGSPPPPPPPNQGRLGRHHAVDARRDRAAHRRHRPGPRPRLGRWSERAALVLPPELLDRADELGPARAGRPDGS